MLTGPEIDRMNERMAQGSRTCHLPDGTPFRAYSKRRFIVVIDLSGAYHKVENPVIIEYRTDDLKKAITFREKRGPGFDYKSIARRFVVDTARDRVRLGRDEWTDALA